MVGMLACEHADRRLCDHCSLAKRVNSWLPGDRFSMFFTPQAQQVEAIARKRAGGAPIRCPLEGHPQKLSIIAIWPLFDGVKPSGPPNTER